MTHPFAITLFLADGKAEGIKIVEKSNWNGRAIACPRLDFPKHRKRLEFLGPGVYLLMGTNGTEIQIYIGEGDPLINRLEGHFRDKDWWNMVIAFTAKDSNLHKASIQFLEARIIHLARETGRFCLKNRNVPSEPSLSEMDRAVCEGFLNEMLLCLPVLGVHFNHSNKPSSQNKSDLFIRAKNILAEGFESSEGFVIRNGSELVGLEEETNSIPQSIKLLRQSLIARGVVIKKDEKKFQFTCDYTFGSPSTAAAVVLGSSSNGRDLWKNHEGVTLKTLQLQALK